MNSNHGGESLALTVEKAYLSGQTDYSMEPLVAYAGDAPVGRIREGDSVIFCCRRGEREIELTEAFTDKSYKFFDRVLPPNLSFVIMTMYHEKFVALPIAFAPTKVKGTLAEAVSRAQKRQLHCSESEKFAHVTFFFNGGNNAAFPNEDDVCIPSPKGVPFDAVPELSLPLVAERVKQGMAEGYDFIVTNFANGDVIGHTANSEAKVKCAEAVDRYLGEVVEKAIECGYTIAVTADHGNLELMVTPEGKPHGAHTSNKVPFVLIGAEERLRDGGSLADVAPTLLKLMGVPKPDSMDGTPLIDGDVNPSKLLLIILDGWGIGEEDGTNPIHIASTPVWDNLLAERPHTELDASGEFVGLQASKAGNSEAGHINIGSGRTVMQDDVRLDAAMRDGSFGQNPVFLEAIERAKRSGAALHLIGLLTKKSSHGSIDYPLALAEMAKELPEVYLHLIFDGRSTEPGSAPSLIRELDAKLAAIGAGVIVGGIGRGIALDRDKNYSRIEKAYNALTLGTGLKYSL